MTLSEKAILIAAGLVVVFTGLKLPSDDVPEDKPLLSTCRTLSAEETAAWNLMPPDVVWEECKTVRIVQPK